MAGKVIEVDKLIVGDALAKTLCSLYNKWAVGRREKEEEWKELRGYLFATDTTKTSNGALPWKNTTTIPKLTQIRDNLHANYMDALFPNDDWLKWEGYSQEDVVITKRKAIEAYMKNKLRESGFREIISKLLYDYIDYGNVFAEACWEKDCYTDPITGEEVVTYIGCKAKRISPFDITFNPLATSFKDSPKFTRYLKDIGELVRDYEDHNDNYLYEEASIKKILENRKTFSSYKMEDLNKYSGYIAEGFGTFSEYLSSGLVELIEFEGDIYDPETQTLKKNRLITIVDRVYILRDIQNPSWLGEDNKVHVGWRDRHDNIYGMGALDNLVGMQYRVDHLENLKADALDLTIHPILVIKGEVDPFTWQPGENIHVPEDGEVTSLVPSSNAFQVNNEIFSLLSLMEEMAGAPKEAMGIRTPGEKTAFEVQQLQNAAGRIFQNKVNKFEVSFMEPLLNKMLEVARRNITTTDLVSVMDDDIGVIDFISITKEDITAKGKLRPIGSRHYAARAQLIQNILGIFNSPIGQMIAPHVSAKKLGKLIEEQMGFEQFGFIKDNIAVMEQGETQRLVNQTQSTLQAESAQSTDEDLLNM